ncbi:hypothetical protein SPRG_14843 [Saprolegnia parasitica CBS 223.65]|uniref:Fe/B12 periplasmic-binding domain-containing protein n=1 Tax=Saprolegnia parasitica (strain CBS 223.65) TaxID=695850 RepID=A0A067C045_SAPPC|nr:hypothetical protein SPRG_14843 [Saprolegnia parasitica CBS 223.65]KDO19936.1 hypothetical protein SPRG_14843 [Saprolegnia parasitica CBS 223.65]|eukprot:XP_012209374.1 hypothetical protein SPRG_14843 [Saprolegnia parasitica CBS 223.65]
MAPLRIVSLLPSATELVYYVLCQLDEDDPAGAPHAQLVGRSHECDWPEALVAGVPMLTASQIKFTTSAEVDAQVRAQLSTGVGLYSVRLELLQSLSPDFIVTQSLCKVCSVDYCMVDELTAGMSPRPVLIDTNPMSVNDVLADIRRIATTLGFHDAGQRVVAALQRRIDVARAIVAAKLLPGMRRRSIGFCEWTDPIFCGGHWTPQLIEMAGAVHPLNVTTCGPETGAHPSRSIPASEFIASDPDIIVVAPCGLDMDATKRELAPLIHHAWWKQLRAVREGRVYLVNGNHMFNRPGPRLVDALEWLVAMLWDVPSACAFDFPAEKWVPPTGYFATS